MSIRSTGHHLYLKSSLELTLKDFIQHEHHKQLMVQSIKAKKPPPGVTIKIHLTAKGQTPKLTEKVNHILTEAGLQIVQLLHDHHASLSDLCKRKAEETRESMEDVATKPLPSSPPPTHKQTQLTELPIKHTNDAQACVKQLALDLKTKREKRKRDNDPNSLEAHQPKCNEPPLTRISELPYLSILAETKVIKDIS